MQRLSHCLLRADSEVSVQQITNKTIHGDAIAVLENLPLRFADLIIIDPPYNLPKSFGDQKFSRLTDSEYAAYLRSWFEKVLNRLKTNGSVYFCGDWRSSAVLQSVMSDRLHVMNRITWQREKGRGAKSNWKNSLEDIWFGVRNPNDYYFNVDVVKLRRKVIAPYRVDGKPKDWEESADGKFRMTHPSNFWDDLTVPYWSMPENTDHPTQKPEKLVAKLILASCPEGGFVFDPFLGSGTTSVVAKKLGRKYCGIEISEEYCCLAEKRLELAERDPTIQGYSDGVFWERNTHAMQQEQSGKKSEGQPSLF